MRRLAPFAYLLLAAPLTAQTPKSDAEIGIERHQRWRSVALSDRFLDPTAMVEDAFARGGGER